MKDIDQKILDLGGTEVTNAFLSAKNRQFDIQRYLISQGLELPKEYIYFSEKYGFGQFNEDIVFRSIDKLPITSEQNLCPVDFIYGWGFGPNSLQSIRETFLDQIDKDYFVFSEGNAGDQLCINQNDRRIYYWHHESLQGEGFYLVANSFLDFIQSLEKNNEIDSDNDLEEEWFSDDF